MNVPKDFNTRKKGPRTVKRVPRPSLRISALERRVLGEYRRIPRPSLKISTLERRDLGQHRRVPIPSLRISALE